MVNRRIPRFPKQIPLMKIWAKKMRAMLHKLKSQKVPCLPMIKPRRRYLRQWRWISQIHQRKIWKIHQMMIWGIFLVAMMEKKWTTLFLWQNMEKRSRVVQWKTKREIQIRTAMEPKPKANPLGLKIVIRTQWQDKLSLKNSFKKAVCSQAILNFKQYLTSTRKSPKPWQKDQAHFSWKMPQSQKNILIWGACMCALTLERCQRVEETIFVFINLIWPKIAHSNSRFSFQNENKDMK